jgi:hypothetical protein
MFWLRVNVWLLVLCSGVGDRVSERVSDRVSEGVSGALHGDALRHYERGVSECEAGRLEEAVEQLR